MISGKDFFSLDNSEVLELKTAYPGKTCGDIVDYVNVFQYMQKALSDYAVDDTGSVMPAKDIDKLISNIDESIASADEFLSDNQLWYVNNLRVNDE